MQCYDEAGDLIQDFQIRFELDETDPQIIRRFAIIIGATVDLGPIPAERYLEEMNDPFWINDSDRLYLNSEFEYADNLRNWLARTIALRSRAGIGVIEIGSRELAGLGLRIPAQQMRAFQDGRPIWRRSALSCNPDQGEDAQSSTSKRLRDALLSWVVFSDLLARHAMQVERKNNQSKFAAKSNAKILQLARLVMARAIGHEGKIPVPRLGLSDLLLGSSAHQIDAAHQNGRTKHFNNHFDRPPGKLSTLIRKEMTDFKKRGRPFDAKFDADAVVDWSATILVALRVALAASADLDRKRSTVRKDLMKEERCEERGRLAREFAGEWLKGVRGVESGKRTTRDVALEDLFDLQKAALIAFAAGVNPQVLFPYINDGIYTDDGRPLTSPLFAGATWLGDLFRKRYLQMEYADASHIAAFCNPCSLPREVPEHRREEWIAATRMMTSFLTEKGLCQLMDGANAVLNDGKTRSVFASAPSRLRTPKKMTSSLTERLASIVPQNDEAVFLPPPIVVEAGWVILPGDYQDAWFMQFNSFRPEDFPGSSD